MKYRDKTNKKLMDLIKKDDAEACCEMAVRYLKGTEGVGRDFPFAYLLLFKAKDSCNRANIILGNMFKKGIFFEKNDQLAQMYYDRADDSDECTFSIKTLDNIIEEVREACDRNNIGKAKYGCAVVLDLISNYRFKDCDDIKKYREMVWKIKTSYGI